MKKLSRISIEGCVRPSISRSVGPSVRNVFVKIAKNGIMRDQGASRVVYPTLFFLYFSYHLSSNRELFCFSPKFDSIREFAHRGWFDCE